MKEMSIEKKYLYLSLILGMLLIFIIPPFQSPDEDSHFKKAYSISVGNLFPTSQTGMAGDFLPNEIISKSSEMTSHMSQLDWKYTYPDLLYSEIANMNVKEKTFNTYSTSTANPISYIGSAIGMAFSRLFNWVFTNDANSVTNTLYFGRIFNLILVSIITFFAIKKSPVLKRTIATIGLLPMTLFMSSMISYDGILISTTLFLLANFFDLIFNSKKEISKKDIIMYGLILFLLISLKLVYCTLFILILFVPKDKYINSKEKIKKILLIVGLALLLLVLFKIPQAGLKLDGNTSNAPHEQLSYIIKNPINYIKILGKTIINGRFFLASTTLGTFGLLDTYLPAPILIIAFLNLITIAISEGITDKFKINWKIKMASLLAVICSVVGMFTAMYILWTSVMADGIGAETISGVQGRYFLPLLFPTLIVFSNKSFGKNKLIKNICEIINNNWILVPIITLSVSLFIAITRFWI